MRAIPYLIPVAITVVFMTTAATSFVWAGMGFVLIIASLRKKIGKFSVAGVVSEYDFFHHSPPMVNLKTASGVFFVGFNAWVLFFLAHHALVIWALAVFIYSVVIFNSNFAVSLAHDLMHSSRKLDRWLSTILLLQNGFFYLEADHIYIHHRHVGTSDDPATARVGEGIYAYLRRSIGARFRMIFFTGNTFPPRRESEIILSCKIRLVACLFYLIGTTFVSWQALICVLAQFVLVTLIYESVTYIQHYGLRREISKTGKVEVVQLHHAWNCYYRTSAWMHYLMPVHSIHH
ncbi:fatty acid desaturase, partial [Persicitalea sp.]|uniref:fatty acid desaturase n=1 Tax=Persicitalea sp. TaxID=3100273 RepID=UPI003593212C